MMIDISPVNTYTHSHMTNYYLAFDCESGGLDPNCTLLTAYFYFFKMVDHKFIFVDDLSLKMRPDTGTYVVEAEALAITRIDLLNHDATAINFSIAGKQLADKLKDWYDICLNDKVKYIVPIGHAIQGDIDRITSNLISHSRFYRYCTYCHIDTLSIASFYKNIGKILPDTKVSLESLINHFNIKVDIAPENNYHHNAEYDTKATVKIFEIFTQI